MPARSHGTDEPSPGEPREPADGVPPGDDPEGHQAPDEGRPEPDPADASDPDAATVPDDLDEGEVASRWDQLVTQLRSPTDPRAWAPDPAVEEAETHFQQPDPGPVLPADPFLRLALVAVLGVPLLVVLAAAFWQDPPMWLLQAAGAAFLGGVLVLLRRLPRDRDEEDDPGSGAVV